MTDMWAYSLWRPWGYAVEQLGKRIENRPRAAPSYLHGERVALHNALKFDLEAALILRQFGFEVPLEKKAYATGITSTAVIEPFSICTRSDLARYGLEAQALWWFGKSVGIVLRDVQVLREPIPVKGRRSQPWKLPAEIAERVRAADAVKVKTGIQP